MTAMFLFAGLIIGSIFLNIRGIGSFGANLSEILKNEDTEKQKNSDGISENSCGDIDKDGLCDNEEPLYGTDFLNPDTDGDGFLDGEEIASGHNPTIKGPDDLLSNTNDPQAINITAKVSTLMAAGFYAGDLSASADPAVYTKALADINDEIVIDGIRALNPNNIPVNKPVFSSDSKEAQEEYLKTVGSIVQFELWGKLVNEPRVAVNKFTDFFKEDQQIISESQKYFNSNSDHYRKVINELNTVSVPPAWLDVHSQILFNLQTLAINHQALSQTNDDLLKGSMAMSNLMSVYQDIQPILVTITKKIKENNLNPPNGKLWALINSLTNDF